MIADSVIPRLWPGRGGPHIDYISAPPRLAPSGERRLAILGSTGSIGRNALAVAREAGLKIAALGAGGNARLLASQAREFRPAHLAMRDKRGAEELESLLPAGYSPEIHIGPNGYTELASLDCADLVLSAQAGSAGLAGTLAAALAGKTIALANKESLVAAGRLIRMVCAETGASILPVDSEHYALFQCASGRGQNPRGLILTASGGPFRALPMEKLASASAEDALKHPNWNMGRKISIDSATLMNKGLELIEAVHLYGMPEEDVSVLIHPQSIVHSLVRMADNSVLAQLAAPDMKLPIAACLLWPRKTRPFARPLDLAEAGTLAFERVDGERFPALSLARKCLRAEAPPGWRGLGLSPACIALNAANETCVELFLAGRLHFLEIFQIVSRTLDDLVFNQGLEPAIAPAGASSGDLASAAISNIARLADMARARALDFAGQ